MIALVLCDDLLLKILSVTPFVCISGVYKHVGSLHLVIKQDSVRLMLVSLQIIKKKLVGNIWQVTHVALLNVSHSSYHGNMKKIAEGKGYLKGFDLIDALVTVQLEVAGNVVITSLN